jgi:hypothetical protein
VSLLATSLPAQATYFIQIIFVKTVILGGVELLRIVPLVMAIIRSCVGPRLSEKERQTTFMGLRPLCDPAGFSHADVASQMVNKMVVSQVIVAAVFGALIVRLCSPLYSFLPLSLYFHGFYSAGVILYGIFGLCRNQSHYVLRHCILLCLHGIHVSSSVCLHLSGSTRFWWQDLDGLYSYLACVSTCCRNYEYVPFAPLSLVSNMKAVYRLMLKLLLLLLLICVQLSACWL